MSAHILRLPLPEAAYARHTERQREANIAEDREGALKAARLVLRSPDSFDDQIIRDACAVLQAYGDGTDYLTADAMIFALNRRERKQAHEVARAETSASIAAQYRWQDVLAGAVAFVICGWALVSAVMWMGGW